MEIMHEINGTFDKGGDTQEVLTKADRDLTEWTAKFLRSTCVHTPQILFPTKDSIQTASDSLHELIKLYSGLSMKRKRGNLFSIEQDMLNESLPRTFHEIIQLCEHLLNFTNENNNIIKRATAQNIVQLHNEIQETNRNLQEYRKVTQVDILWHPNTREFREFINEWMTELARVITSR